jgi:KaiC/GvpD/RAD55 family RecA-like ATPase
MYQVSVGWYEQGRTFPTPPMGERDTTEGNETGPRELIASLRGRNVLLTGPPMVGKDEFALDVVGVAGRDGRDVVLVTTTRSAPRLLEDRNPDELGYVIDCTPVDVTEREWVTSLTSPGDLTGISMPLSDFLADATAPAVVFDSLSTVLMYTGQSAAFRFLSVLTTHVRSADGLGLFTLDSSAHDEQTVRTLAQLFDARVQVRTQQEVTEVKATGIDGLATEWTQG